MVFSNIQSNILVHFANFLSKQDNQICTNIPGNRTLSDMPTLYHQTICNAWEAKQSGKAMYYEVLTHI